MLKLFSSFNSFVPPARLTRKILLDFSNSIKCTKNEKILIQDFKEKNFNLEWELDLYLRPILDERGKKLWELVVTDSQRSFVFSEFFRNNKVNSASLKLTLNKLLKFLGCKRPTRCNYFRSQSQNIIKRALNDLKIWPVPSRRCPSLMNLLEERLELVYKKHPGYCMSKFVVSTNELSPPSKLPSALKGEQWAFVQISVKELKKEVQVFAERRFFGSTIAYCETLNLVSSEKIIPGIAVFSKRSISLSAWTSSLELASISAEVNCDSLILETGINQR